VAAESLKTRHVPPRTSSGRGSRSATKWRNATESNERMRTRPEKKGNMGAKTPQEAPRDAYRHNSAATPKKKLQKAKEGMAIQDATRSGSGLMNLQRSHRVKIPSGGEQEVKTSDWSIHKEGKNEGMAPRNEKAA